MNTFLDMVKAVEENNKMNDAKWSDFECVEHLIDVYGDLEEEFKDVSKVFLNSLISNNGDNAHVYIDAMDCLVYGHTFANNRG